MPFQLCDALRRGLFSSLAWGQLNCPINEQVLLLGNQERDSCCSQHAPTRILLLPGALSSCLPPAAQLAFRHRCGCHSCKNSAQCAGIAIDVSQHERTYSFLKGQVSEGSAEVPRIKRLKVWYNHQMSCGRGNPLILGSRLMKGCAQVLVAWGFLILPFLCSLASNKT